MADGEFWETLFLCSPGRNPCGFALDSYCNVKGSSHPVSGAPDVLQMKVTDAFLATGIHLSVTTLDLQMHIYKRNIDGICITTLARTWKELLLAASLLPLRTR